MEIESNKPTYNFLLCSERSGSNFITKLMNNHSLVCGPSTKHIINPLARNYFRYLPFNHENWVALINDILNLFNVDFSIWKSKFTLEEITNNVKAGDIQGLINYFFNKECQENKKHQLFIKEIKTYEFYPFLKHYFPKAKYIYQVRDPRDMALSWKNNKSHKGGIISAANQWKIDQQQYLKILHLESTKNNIISIHYEKLVNNPKKELNKVLNLMELSFEDDMIIMGKDELTNKNASQQKAWKNLAKPIMSNNYNKFMEALTSREIQYIEKICYFEMHQLGYQPLYTWDELCEIGNKEISNYNNKELNDFEYIPNKGVVDNMKAKELFYKHM